MEEKALVPTATQEVNFYGDLITVATVNDTPYVAIKPISDYLGLRWSGQFERIQRDPVLSEEAKLIRVIRINSESQRGRPDNLCLPLEYLPGWLFGIDANRVKPELRDGIIRYQRECFRILWQAFQSRAATLDVIPQLVADQAETRAHVNNLEQDVKAIDQSVKEMRVILSEIRGLSSAHRATVQKMVNEISRISGVKHQYIYSDLKDIFHVASYADIPDEKWAEVQKWLQQRLDTARRVQGIEQQPTLFGHESKDK